jgi:hypothetical protein
MAKRASEGEESVSKRSASDLSTFFQGEREDDVYVIMKYDYSEMTQPLDVYFKTEALATEFLNYVKARDQRNAKDYAIQKLRLMPSPVPDFIADYFPETQPRIKE